MKSDWDQLAQDFQNSKTQLIADVDCTGTGEPLCEQYGVEGFPTLKWGDPNDLQEYEGGREYDELKEFANENLKPQCSPSNMDLCDDTMKQEIQTLMELPADELDTMITTKEEQLAEIDAEFAEFIEGLQNQYEEKMAQVENDKAEIKKSGLGLMKSVRTFLATKAGNEEL